MTSRLRRSHLVAVLAYVFSLLLLVGAPVRLPPPVADQGGAHVAALVMAADDVQGDVASDSLDTSSSDTHEDNSGNGNLDDIIHLPDIVGLWASLPSQRPADGPYDVGHHNPGRLLRPPEAA
ncbi:hypothetical protein [Dyella sp. ASV21]|uniref:hypothetical protein n=1 Tax=Dyella sp. ASV21 TaxID=2795114 RepID=UPI0018EAD69A|nr:hypothetical protein [Dyella sp. ASV21]